MREFAGAGQNSFWEVPKTQEYEFATVIKWNVAADLSVFSFVFHKIPIFCFELEGCSVSLFIRCATDGVLSCEFTKLCAHVSHAGIDFPHGIEQRESPGEPCVLIFNFC